MKKIIILVIIVILAIITSTFWFATICVGINKEFMHIQYNAGTYLLLLCLSISGTYACAIYYNIYKGIK